MFGLTAGLRVRSTNQQCFALDKNCTVRLSIRECKDYNNLTAIEQHERLVKTM